MSKIKVVWVCHFSNSIIRERLKFAKWSPSFFLKRVMGKNLFCDFSVWITNAIREFEKYDDIDLHIIAPHIGILGVQNFEIRGINYHFFHSEDDNIISLVVKRLGKEVNRDYRRNTNKISDIVKRIQPDIIHYIGAENPYYSLSALSMPTNIPLIVSLQTLMSDPDFIKNYPISKDAYVYRSNIEKSIIKRADYIATKVDYFRAIIRSQIGDVKFLDMTLAVGAELNTSVLEEKKYDFVYFAANISKAVDYAIEAFAIAKKKHKDITLHVIGGYDDSLMSSILIGMDSLGLTDGVDFTGKLPTYDDVIKEIRKARFALLPLKIDLISSTIREAMANGLPVITTVTPATPNLNQKRESVLLSEKGDLEQMADNMIKLLEDESLVNLLRENGFQTVVDMYDNVSAMQDWRSNYKNIVACQKNIK